MGRRLAGKRLHCKSCCSVYGEGGGVVVRSSNNPESTFGCSGFCQTTTVTRKLPPADWLGYAGNPLIRITFFFFFAGVGFIFLFPFLFFFPNYKLIRGHDYCRWKGYCSEQYRSPPPLLHDPRIIRALSWSYPGQYLSGLPYEGWFFY